MEFYVTIINYGIIKVTYGMTVGQVLFAIGHSNLKLKNKFNIELTNNIPLRGSATFILDLPTE